MKLHGAIELGSTSILLNNINKYVKKLLNSFGANGLQLQKEQNLTLPTSKNDL